MIPYRLRAAFHEKVWGSEYTEPWYPNRAGKIGEVWHTDDPELPLLFKFLFTSEKLSVQVHPDDRYARQVSGCRGKTEMWRILKADPGAAIALGLRQAMTLEEARAACESGAIEGLLQWVPVSAGETYFVPAGVIHAIGAGITLCEIQQNSDITYRLYDYGRPRELHLDHGLAVARLEPFDGKCKNVRCPYFEVEEIEFTGRLSLRTETIESAFLILDGEGRLHGEPFRLGEAWLAPPDSSVVFESDAPVTMLHVIAPQS
jgi:mannose-6-phosphate isomerase